jgi:hypothetical protein
MADAWRNLMACGTLTSALCDTLDGLHRSAATRGVMDQPAVVRMWTLCEELGVSTSWALCLDTAAVRGELRARQAAHRAAA